LAVISPIWQPPDYAESARISIYTDEKPRRIGREWSAGENGGAKKPVRLLHLKAPGCYKV
jgi:hypothetical protein